MVNITEDISKLTTIPDATLTKLFNIETYCIGHAVQETKLLEGELTSINIGIGTLHIKHSGDEIKYKFIPSTKLENAITETVKTGKSPLVLKVEDALRDRIMNVYKDLL